MQLEPALSFFMGSESVEYEVSSGTGGMQGSQGSSTGVENVYGLLNTEIMLPLSIYIGDFDLEFNYSLNIPLSQEEGIQYPASSFFSFSLGYLLPLR